jgi:hypothetical protein
VPEHDDVGVQGLEVQRSVLQRLAFLQARSRGRDVHDIRAEPHGGNLEGRPGPSAWFDEKIYERLAAEGGDFFEAAFPDALEGRGRVEEKLDLLRAELVEPDQVFAGPDLHWVTTRTESGTPSRFSKRTRIFSPRAVGTFFPT